MHDSFDRVTVALSIALLIPLAHARSAWAQPFPLQTQYVSPTAPLAPTEMAQCQALDDEWKAIRKSVDAQHTACLDQQAKNKGRQEAGRTCSYAACQPYHGAYDLGTKDVDRCREQVSQYQAEERRRKAEEARRAEEQRRREEEARQAADARRREAERKQREEQQREDRRREDERQTAADREKERQKKAADAMQSARDADRAAQQAQQAINALRDQEAEKLKANESSAKSRLDDKVAKAVDKAGNAAQAIADQAKQLAGNSSKDATSTGFDIPGADAAETPAGNLGSKLNSYINALTTMGGAMVPWAGVNFSLINNAAQQTNALIDQLSNSIASFDTDDGRALEQALNAFPEKVFGPKAVLRAVAENAAATYVTNTSRELLVDPAIERATIQWRRAIDDNDPSALFRFGQPPEPPRPSAKVFYWWDRSPSPAYNEWRENVVVFFPSAAESPSAGRQLVTEWVVGALSAAGVSEALSRMESARERRP